MVPDGIPRIRVDAEPLNASDPVVSRIQISVWKESVRPKFDLGEYFDAER